MKSALVRLLTLGLAAAFLAGFSGCAGPGKSSKPDMVTSNYGPDDEVTLPPETGSHIPRKVKVKDVLAEGGTGKSKTEQVDVDEFTRSVRQGVRKPEN